MDDAEAGAAAAERNPKRTQPFDVELGARIRAVRVAAGMSQAALGEVVGVSYQQMQKYEMGGVRISAGTLFLFATALKVHVGTFVGSTPQHVAAKSGRDDDLSAKMVVLFQQIDDPGIRKQFVALAAALASTTEGEQAP